MAFGGLIIRPWVHHCMSSFGPDVSMSYKTACRLIFKDLKTLLRIEKKHDARRRLALAMGLHPRLGGNSLLSLLGETEVLRLIAYDKFSFVK